MAKRISDEIIKLKIIVDGNEAQKRVVNLELANNKLNKELDNQKNILNILQKRKTQLSKDEEKNASKIKETTEKIKQASEEIKKLSTAIEENKKAIKLETHTMDIMGLTMQQLRQRAKDLQGTLSHMTPDSKGYKQLENDLQKINARAAELRAGSQASASEFAKLNAKFQQYSGIIVGISVALYGLGQSIQKVIAFNNKLEDAQTAVAKTTGLTEQEVRELTQAYSEFNTRTSKIDLLKISEIGGRLGVPKSEIKDFTKEVDKAYVALGDTFSGGAEKIAESLGKIKNLYSQTKDLGMAEAISQIGSALNELGASGAATEANVAEFAIRVGALPETLKPSVDESLALGAAFEESGISAERAGTAYSSFVRTAATNADRFAEVMKLSTEEVQKMINTDPKEFFLKFAEGMKGLDAVDTAAILEHVKLNDQYVTSIVGSAAENIDRFRDRLELSNKSLKEATSLQEEFNKVNNNAAAIYEKTKKAFIGMFMTEGVAKTLNWLVEMMGKLLGVTKEESEETSVAQTIFIAFTRTLFTLVGIIGSAALITAIYNNLIKESIARTILLDSVTKAKNLTTKVGTAIQIAWNTVIGLGGKLIGALMMGIARLTGATALQTTATNIQTAAQAKLNAVAAANPFGAILAIIGALIAAYYTYSYVIGENAEKQSNLNKINEEAANIAADETSKLDALYKKATDVSKSIEERKKAVQRLKELYPSYFKNISDEIILTGQATSQYKSLKNAILESARARAGQDMITKITEESMKKELKVTKEMNELEEQAQKLREARDKGQKTIKKETLFGLFTKDEDINGKIRDLDTQITNREHDLKIIRQNTEKETKPIQNMIEQANKKAEVYQKDKESKEQSTSNYKTQFGADKKKTKSHTEKADKELKQYQSLKNKYKEMAERFGDERAKLEQEQWENELALMQEGYFKEITLIQAEESKKIEELKKQKSSKKDLENLDKIIAREKNEAEKAPFIQLKEEMLQRNAQIDKLIEQQEYISNKKRELADEKLKKKKIDAEKEAFENINKIQDEEMNKQLLKLVTVEEQKTFLKVEFNKEEVSQIKTWEEGKAAIEKAYQEKKLEEQEKYLTALLEQYENAQKKFQLTDEQIKYVEEIQAQILKIKVAKKSLLEQDAEANTSNFSSLIGKGTTDIFGLSQEQWELMFTNTDKLESQIYKVIAGVKAAQEAMQNYFQFTKENQARELQNYQLAHDKKKRILDNQLAIGYISQQEYKHKTMELENDLAMKKYLLELEEAKREKAMKITNIITSTAEGIATVWAKKGANPIMAGILTGIISAMGAAQTAIVLAQPLPAPPSLPGAEKGYYPVIRQQDGKMFNARKKTAKSGLYDEPTMLVGEQGKNFPELVVAGGTMKRIDPNIQRAYMQEIARVEGFQNGLYPQTANTGAANDEIMLRIITLLNKNIEVLQKLEDNGITAYIDKTARNGKEIQDMIKDYNNIRNKNKH